MSTHDGTLPPEASSEALAPGSQLLSGQYEIVRYLSSGGFGITYLAKDSLNRTVVIKECFPEAFCSRIKKTVRARTRNYVNDFKSIVALFIREAHALSRLNHKSVVGVHQVFEDNETAYMALDFVDGKDLLEIIESGSPAMSPKQVRRLTLSLLDAIAHVHSQDLLHRDISPDNILVDKSGHPVLIDFGAAREEASRKSRVLSAVLVVKDGYSPQEFYVAGSQQYPCSDLYALAASLSHLISGEAPPNSQARLAALASSQPDLYKPLRGRFPAYDDAFLAAIDKAMSIVPADRVQSAEDWVLMIDHARRAEVARERARDDDAINLTVSNLIQSMQDDGDPARAETPQPEPKRVVAQAAPVQSRPLETKYDEAFLRDLYDDAEDETAARSDAVRDSDVDEMLEELYQGAEPAPPPGADTDPVPPLVSKADTPLPETEQPAAAPPKADTHEPPAPNVPANDPIARLKARATLPPVMSQEEFDAVIAAEQVAPTGRNLRRLATIPVILFAYFFLGHTALQFDNVHAVTVGQIITLGEDYGYWTASRSYTAGG
ncbi:serine/threonine protein kinase [Roseobacter sinensis]|uniref:Protein kinase n=1 Tax=Roseobacter sinensis TaxID=2931391 RepID=A0ABT3BHR9_9RHOB|nr:serine/threonine-protein kinase [Roseobacter sp. WL0113]MCV3273118.1 protein kinase [Roseobacter sp. WL0113]